MSRSRHTASTALVVAGLLCLFIGATGCGSSPEKPDQEPTEQTTAEPADEDQAGEDADQKSADLEAEDDEEVTDPDAPIEISDRFRRDLDAALNKIDSDDRDGAVSSLQNLVGDGGAGFLAAFNLGVIYENEGAYQKAAKRYAQALKKNPDFSPGLLNLVRLYLRMDSVPDADKLVRKYMDARPQNMDHRAVALQIDLHQGKYEETIANAKRILRRDETNAEAMLAMAEANIQLDRAELAEAILDRVLKLQPERAEIFFKYARIRVEADQISDAIALLQRALNHRPAFPEARNNLGVLYHEAGDYSAALEQLEAAIASYPDYKEAHLNKGNTLKAQREYREAEDSFKQALEIDPKYADALFNLGVLYLDSDLEGVEMLAQLEQSIEYFDRYKETAGSQLGRDSLADKYIKEARNNIEAEEQRQEMMRQAQKGAEEEPEADDADSSDDDGGGEAASEQ
ncbi:MAG: tetratricopeptide repeat protein [Persicimonas sp.]